MLMRLFPGRLLCELDEIDEGRLSRALQARRYAAAWYEYHKPGAKLKDKARHKPLVKEIEQWLETL